MKRSRHMLVAGFVGAAVMLAGCTAALVGGAAVAAAAGTYVYTEGRLKTVEDAPIDKVYAATVKAMEDMKLQVKEQNEDAHEARVVAETASDTDVKIALERISDTETEVRIRVGVLGDEALSMEVLSKIRENMAKS